MNIGRALHFFRLSHKNNLATASQYYGMCLMHPDAPPSERDPAAGLKLLQEAAERDQPPALFVMAELHYHGNGSSKLTGAEVLVKQDYDKAVALLKKCTALVQSQSTLNNSSYPVRIAIANAYSLLGLCHLQGRGVKQDAGEALKLLRVAVELRDRLNREKDAYLLYNLGVCYLKGEGGSAVPRDAHEAVRYFKRAIEVEESRTGGNVPPNYAVYYALGWCYRYGEGVAKSRNEAMRLFEKAAGQGNHAGAQYQLGMLHLKGRGERNESLVGRGLEARCNVHAVVQNLLVGNKKRRLAEQVRNEIANGLMDHAGVDGGCRCEACPRGERVR